MYFHWRKYACKSLLQNDRHFVSASMCLTVSWIFFFIIPRGISACWSHDINVEQLVYQLRWLTATVSDQGAWFAVHHFLLAAPFYWSTNIHFQLKAFFFLLAHCDLKKCLPFCRHHFYFLETIYRQVSNMRRIKNHHLKYSRTVLWLSLSNTLNPDVELRMKM